MFGRLSTRTIVYVLGFVTVVLLYFILPTTTGVTRGLDLQRGVVSTVLMVACLVAIAWAVKSRK
jgi:hypothetical protein